MEKAKRKSTFIFWLLASFILSLLKYLGVGHYGWFVAILPVIIYLAVNLTCLLVAVFYYAGKGVEAERKKSDLSEIRDWQERLREKFNDKA